MICIAAFIYFKKKRDKRPYDYVFKRKWLSKKKLHYYQDNNSPDDPLNPDYHDYLNEKHFKKIFYCQDTDKRFPIEAEYVNDLNLCWRISVFINDMRSLYSALNEQELDTTSGTIDTSSISTAHFLCNIRFKKCIESNIMELFSDRFELKEDDDIIEYLFFDVGQSFVLIVGPSQRKYNKYYPVIIMDNKHDSPNVYLIARLYYKKDFGNDVFDNYKLEEFRDDDWLKRLLSNMYDLRKICKSLRH